MLKIGVTGGIGSGKSTVCRFFERAGAIIFNADEEAKNLLDDNLAIRDSLVRLFGKDVLRFDGSIDRTKLAALAFSSPDNQQKLNNLIHPVVFQKLKDDYEYVSRSGTYRFFVVDAPLLFEAGWYKEMDYNIIVYAPEKLRLERAEKRGTQTRKDIEARMRLQMPEKVKRRMADFIIENDGTLDELKAKTLALIKQLEIMM